MSAARIISFIMNKLIFVRDMMRNFAGGLVTGVVVNAAVQYSGLNSGQPLDWVELCTAAVIGAAAALLPSAWAVLVRMPISRSAEALNERQSSRLRRRAIDCPLP